MKTPREILLARHRPAEPKLDAIRQSAIAAVCDRRIPVDQASKQRLQVTVTTQSWPAGFVTLCRLCLDTPWRELFLPSRRLWAVLAVVWVLIFVINISQRDNLSSLTGQPVRSAAIMMSWQTQQRWMNELFAERATAPEADRPRNVTPRPRSDKNDMMAA